VNNLLEGVYINAINKGELFYFGVIGG